MTGAYGPSQGDEEPIGRPFMSAGSEPAAPSGPEIWEPVDRDVRPYLITGGRSAPDDVRVAMHTVVVAVGTTPADRPGWGTGLERSQLLGVCSTPCSVAEVAARINVALGVAQVLVGDLIAEGLLDFSTTAVDQSRDVTFLERLIDGVSAL